MTQENIDEPRRWKKIPSFPFYEVSDCGSVRRNNKILKQSPNSKGYPRVTMSVGGKSISKTVHSLLLEAFVGPRPIGMHSRHIDGQKTNNILSNLTYCTPSENEADKIRHGTQASGDKNGMRRHPQARPKGEYNGNSKLTECDVMFIREQLAICNRGAGAELARKFGVSQQIISNIKTGRVWKHI